MAIAVILARRLGPKSFGLFVFVQWLIEMTFLVYSVGLTGVATRFFPQSAGDEAGRFPGFNQWFLRAALLAGLLTSGFAALAALFFSGLGKSAPIAAVTFWAASYSLWALLGARAQGLFQFKRFAVSSLIFVCVAIAGLALPSVGGDFLGAMLIVAAANLAAAVCCATDLFSSWPKSSVETLAKPHSELIRLYATNAWLTTIVASLVWGRGEISLVKGHLGDSGVGYYSVGLTLSGLVNQGMGLLTGALWPQIARAWDTGQRDDLLRFSSLVTALLMLIAGISAGFVICFAPNIVVLLFGEKFLPSSRLAMILALGALGLASGCANLVVQAATNGKFARDVTTVGGIALFGAAFVLIPYFGMEGAALARSTVQIATAVLTFLWIRKVLGGHAGTDKNLQSFVLLVTLAGSLAALLSATRPQFHIWSLCALFSLYCGLVYAICSRGWDTGILRELRKLSEFSNA